MDIRSLHKQIIVECIFPLLDQVSIFRLSRSSKTLHTMLDSSLPRKAVLEHFGWKFANEKSAWKLARKRHESGKWCIGGCGKQSHHKIDNLTKLMEYNLTRPTKPPLRICPDCICKRRSHWPEKTCVLEEACSLRDQLWHRNPYDPFIPVLSSFLKQEHDNNAVIPFAEVGDLLIPRHYVCDPCEKVELKPLTIVSVRQSNVRWYGDYVKDYVMADGSYVESDMGVLSGPSEDDSYDYGTNYYVLYPNKRSKL